MVDNMKFSRLSTKSAPPLSQVYNCRQFFFEVLSRLAYRRGNSSIKRGEANDYSAFSPSSDLDPSKFHIFGLASIKRIPHQHQTRHSFFSFNFSQSAFSHRRSSSLTRVIFRLELVLPVCSQYMVRKKLIPYKCPNSCLLFPRLIVHSSLPTFSYKHESDSNYFRFFGFSSIPRIPHYLRVGHLLFQIFFRCPFSRAVFKSHSSLFQARNNVTFCSWYKMRRNLTPS